MSFSSEAAAAAIKGGDSKRGIAASLSEVPAATRVSLVMRSLEERLMRVSDENKLLRDEFGMLRGDVEALMLRGAEAVVAATSTGTKTTNGAKSRAERRREKRRKKKKNLKGGEATAGSCWGAMCLTKIATSTSAAMVAVVVMLASVALLVSASLGNGIIGDSGPTSLLERSGDDDHRRAVATDLAASGAKDSASRPPPGDRATILEGVLQESNRRRTDREEKRAKALDNELVENMLLPMEEAPIIVAPDDEEDGTMMPRRSLLGTKAPSYYAYLPGSFCDIDISGRPGPDDGMAFYVTAEECCLAEFSVPGSEWLATLCLANSPPLPQTSATFKPTTSSMASSPPTTPALSTMSNHPSLLAAPGILEEEVSDEDSIMPTASAIASHNEDESIPPECDANPEMCGCQTLFQSDYRGTIDMGATGIPCARWDEQLVKDVITKFGIEVTEKDYVNFGLNENYCRNPDIDPYGPWCIDAVGDLWYCDVPICGAPTGSPTASSIPTSSTGPTESPSTSALPSSSPTEICPAADIEACGCEVVGLSDYRGTINMTLDGYECEVWIDFHIERIPNAGLEENFCRGTDNVGNTTEIANGTRSAYGPWCTFFDKTGTLDWDYCDIPVCDPCSCMPPCGQPNNEECGCPSFFQAEECCAENDLSCKCSYLKEACRKSLENNITDFCDIAEDECCGSDPNCKCTMYEQICYESPGQATCGHAAESCCIYAESEDAAELFCKCDLWSSTAATLSYESQDKFLACSEAATWQRTSPHFEKQELDTLFKKTGGLFWSKNDGWLDKELPHCKRFGVTCNDYDIIIGINLRNNNLTGPNPSVDYFPELEQLDLAENYLHGNANLGDYVILRHLVHIDISGNYLTGNANLLFSQATRYANFSHNNLTSVGLRRFNAAYNSLQVMDLSNNIIDQNVSDMFLNIPPNLQELILSNNALRGALPDPFPKMETLELLDLGTNNMDGTLPDLPSSTPRLKTLDLSNQKQTKEGGLSGTLPPSITKLDHLSVLNLAGNKLSQAIPSTIGNFDQLQVLNLSSNLLNGSIPLALANLKGFLEILDLTTNELTGMIPSELGTLKGTAVHLTGNTNLSTPAPLSLCFLPLPGYDGMNTTAFCPEERNALKVFYDSAKGQEWTVDGLWVDEYESHCSWHGVTCDPTNNYVVKLKLRSNGLSGTLSKKIADLSFLEELDLSDNNIKGSIPTEIGLLHHLTYLRLSYNAFVGNNTNFGSLQHLEFIQIHGNRLSGTIPPLKNFRFSDPKESSFVSDCGNPSDFEDSLECENCTMCCNADGNCYPKKDTNIKKVGFRDYVHFTWAFFGCLFGASFALALSVFTFDKFRNNRHLSRDMIREQSLIHSSRDKKHALDQLGNDSVYQFFLSKSWVGWIIVLVTIIIQLVLLFVFVNGAEIDLSDDKTDLVYTWKCTRDKDACDDTSDLSELGWISFAILMSAYMLKDVINGVKLIVLSGKERHKTNTKWRIFLGGMLMTTVTIFTLYVSIIYNDAIATSDTEIIMNSVVILFITDVDERLYKVLMVINSDWVKGLMSEGEQTDSEIDRRERADEEAAVEAGSQQDASGGEQNLVEKVQSLKKMFEALGKTVQAMQKENAELKSLIKLSQDASV